MLQNKIGLRIRELRKIKLKLSQENFARSIGLDRTYIASVENGKRNISVKTLKIICDGLNISLSEFFNDI